MQLHCREYPGPAAGGRLPVLLLHGLFGSGTNWHGIARRLAAEFPVWVPDLRNHGRSPHGEPMDYPALAGDVRELLDRLGLGRVLLVGHSLGGKVAMWLALSEPARVWGLVPVDMAPVRYGPAFGPVLQALAELDLSTLESRGGADRQLARTLADPGLRGYLLQNLVRDPDGWAWRLNLPVLRRAMDTLLDFPAGAGVQPFPGAALFLYGANSDYLGPARVAAVRAWFPFARLRPVPNAGHWVYSDAPEAFLAALLPFLRERAAADR
jgi:esterase